MNARHAWAQGAPAAAFAATARQFAAPGGSLLRLEGVPVGFVRAVAGGNAVGQVVVEPPVVEQGAPVAHKHIGAVRFEDISFEVDLGMSQGGMLRWLQEMLDGKQPRKSGEIVVVDANLKERAVMSFSAALLTEVTFPALDASSRDAGAILVKLTPALTRWREGSGAPVSGVFERQKRWLPANFRFELGALSSNQVAKIDSFTIKQKVVEDPLGEMRAPERGLAPVVVPNLTLTMAEDKAGDYLAFHEDFVLRGNNGAQNEKTGIIHFLDASLKDELLSLALAGVGITTVARGEGGAGDAVRRVRIELYVERMKLDLGATF